MKSNTKISNQLKRKTNPELIETVILSKKNEAWKEIASILTSPRSGNNGTNLGEINKIAKDGEIIVIPGKVLSSGEISKKLKIVAFSFSNEAKEKILNAKGEALYLIDEIKKNPSAKGVRILTRK